MIVTVKGCLVTGRLGLHFEDDLQFDRRAKWQTRDTKDETRRDGLLAEYISKQLRCRIGDFRVLGELRRCGDVHAESHDAAHAFERTQVLLGERKRIERGRAGVGWHAWHCGACDPCRRGDFFACQTGVQVTGISFDGGYADYMIAPATALALVPADLPASDAAPLMCAGVTTFNALRHSGARPGDLVAVLGIGGLGHLGIQYAANMGFRTVAIARGSDKESLARQLGATHYIDSQSADPAAELAKLGGARVVLVTVTHGPAMSATVGGLAPHGRLMVLGAAGPTEVSPLLLIMGRRAVEGWYSGTSIHSQGTLAFSLQSGVRSMNEACPLERVAKAYDRMMSGMARFRVVLMTAR